MNAGDRTLAADRETTATRAAAARARSDYAGSAG